MAHETFEFTSLMLSVCLYRSSDTYQSLTSSSPVSKTRISSGESSRTCKNRTYTKVISNRKTFRPLPAPWPRKTCPQRNSISWTSNRHSVS